MARNIYSLHADPAALAGYAHWREIPVLLYHEIEKQVSDPTHNKEISDYFKPHQATLGKDLNIALRVSGIYRRQKDKKFWPIGGEVDMALLRSPKHCYHYLIEDVGPLVQTDPRYIKILDQMHTVSLAEYLGHLVRRSIPVTLKFKNRVLKIIKNDVPASLVYAAETWKRNPELEPVLLRMSDNEWQDLVKNNPQLNQYVTRLHGSAAYFTAWGFYLRQLRTRPGEEEGAISDAQATGFGHVGRVNGQN